MSEKLSRLLDRLDTTQPSVATIRAAADSSGALLTQVTRAQRPRHRFEYERKTDILGYLRDHYESWRHPDLAEARRFEAMTIDQARGPRATAAIASLGAAWWATGDERWGKAFERFFLQTRTGEMFNWGEFNGTQLDLDLDAWFLLLDCPGFSREGRIAFLDHVFAIADDAWDNHTSTWQQNSMGTEGHNWYLHGAMGLPTVGLAFPEFKRSTFLLRSGVSIFEDHLRGHYKPDGGARETTLGYNVGNLLCLWDFFILARRNGVPLSPRFLERTLDATMFLLRLMTPDGYVPVFGDTGRWPAIMARLAASAVAATGDGRCKWYCERAKHAATGDDARAGTLPNAIFWRVGLEGAATYESTREVNPNHTSILMGHTGYAALRDGDGPDANYLGFAAADRGPIVTSHGHNDIFSIEVHAHGKRYIGEIGPAPYGTSPGRDYDQKTEAHSTLAIVGTEQAELMGEWRWHSVVTPQVRRWITEPTHDFIDAAHEGYYRYQRRETLHRRKVFFLKRSAVNTQAYWVVFDWVESNIENDYRAYFHGLVPGRIDGSRIVLQGDGQNALVITAPANDSVTLEQLRPQGWLDYVTELKVDPQDYPCFAFGKRAASDCMVWLIVPQSVGDAPPLIERIPVTLNGKAQDAHGATALRVALGGREDLLCVSHADYDAELEFGGVRMWGHFAFRRRGAAPMTIDYTMADGVCGR